MNTIDIDSLLLQTGVYWPPNGVGGTGQTTYGTAVEFACRWDENAQIMINSKGKDKEVSSVVIVNGVLGLLEDGRAFFGSLSDLPAGVIADPTTDRRTREIKAVLKIPSVDVTQRLDQLGVG